MQAQDRAVKCVVVGDSGTGKTCLRVSFSHNLFPTDKMNPKLIDDKQNVTINVDEESVDCTIWDLPTGVEDIAHLRPLIYPHTDVVVMCFSLIDHGSLENVKAKWFPEVSHYCPKVPIILVGTKSDLCADKNSVYTLKQKKVQTAVTSSQAHKVKRKVSAFQYVECSAFTQTGVRTVFEEAMRAVLFPKRKRRRKSGQQHACCIS